MKNFKWLYCLFICYAAVATLVYIWFFPDTRPLEEALHDVKSSSLNVHHPFYPVAKWLYTGGCLFLLYHFIRKGLSQWHQKDDD